MALPYTSDQDFFSLRPSNKPHIILTRGVVLYASKQRTQSHVIRERPQRSLFDVEHPTHINISPCVLPKTSCFLSVSLEPPCQGTARRHLGVPNDCFDAIPVGKRRKISKVETNRWHGTCNTWHRYQPT